MCFSDAEIVAVLAPLDRFIAPLVDPAEITTAEIIPVLVTPQGVGPLVVNHALEEAAWERARLRMQRGDPGRLGRFPRVR